MIPELVVTMHREGHLGVALGSYAPIGAITLGIGFEDLAIMGALGAAGLAMAPDIDIRIPFLTHRGPTHTVWFAGLVGILCVVGGIVAGQSSGILAALGLGLWAGVVGTVTVCAHLLADALTPAGIRPFAPIRDRSYSYGFARASNPIANYGLLVLGMTAVGGALWVGQKIASLP